MFFSLFKYYRQSYKDLMRLKKEEFEDFGYWENFVERFFDRVETAYCTEWAGRSSEEQIHELSSKNRLLSNEKNRYLTVFESLEYPALIMNDKGMIENYNAAAGKLLFNDARKESYYYDDKKEPLYIEWLSSKMEAQNYSFGINKFTQTVAHEEKAYFFAVAISALQDVSGKNDGFVALMYDNTDLQEIKQRYEYALTGTNEGLWDWNLKTNEIYFSPRWKGMLGFEDDELPCEFSSWKDRVHPDDLQRALDEINDHITKKTDFYYCEHRLRHKNGSWIWIMDKGRALFDENGEPFRMVGTHTDMTYIKENEQKLKDMQDISVAQSRYAAMGEMISMIAHQWRQPITAIGMSVNNMLLDIDIGGVDNAAFSIHLRSIDEQVRFLSQTIDDFRNFFKPKMSAEETSIGELVGGVLKIIKKSFESDNIAIETEIKGSCDIKFTTNKSDMIQAILVILQNAKDALLENETKNAKIQIGCNVNEDENSLSLYVCDNAGGVPQELKYKIFEPYFSTKTIKNGTGLGLYIAKTIVEKHEGGSMWVENQDVGACFWIKLPLSGGKQGMRE